MFLPGDLVFAKLKGYPYWPAKIISPKNLGRKNLKFHVKFYGDGSRAVVEAGSIEYYKEKRDVLGRLKKHRGFNLAISEIEDEIKSGYNPCDINSDQSFQESLKILDSVVIIDKNSSSTKSYEIPASPCGETVSCSQMDVTRTQASDNSNSPDSDEQVWSTSQPSTTHPVIKITEHSPRIIKTPSPSKINNYEFVHKGNTYRIPLDINRPTTYMNCPKNKLDWDQLVMNKAKELEFQITSGDLTLQEALSIFSNFTISRYYKRKQFYKKNFHQHKILRIENKLLELEEKLRESLFDDEPVFHSAFKYLNDVLALPFTSLMVKKNPNFVNLLQQLYFYKGNDFFFSDEDNNLNLEEKDKTIFSLQCALVRGISQQVLDKIKRLFNYNDDNFERELTYRLIEFEDFASTLSKEEFLSLANDPTEQSHLN